LTLNTMCLLTHVRFMPFVKLNSINLTPHQERHSVDSTMRYCDRRCICCGSLRKSNRQIMRFRTVKCDGRITDRRVSQIRSRTVPFADSYGLYLLIIKIIKHFVTRASIARQRQNLEMREIYIDRTWSALIRNISSSFSAKMEIVINTGED